MHRALFIHLHRGFGLLWWATKKAARAMQPLMNILLQLIAVLAGQCQARQKMCVATERNGGS